jgi:O-antigen ligase
MFQPSLFSSVSNHLKAPWLNLFCYALYSFFLPSYLLKINLNTSNTLPFLDILQLILLLALLWRIKKTVSLSRIFIFLKNNFALQLIFIIFISLFFSILISPTPESITSSLGILKSYFLLPASSALCLIWLQKNNALSFKTLGIWYFFYTSLLSVLTLITFFTGYTTYDQRAAIFFSSPNFLAMTVIPGILINLQILLPFLQKNTPRYFLFFLFTIFLQTFALTLTKSIGGCIALFIALLFQLIYLFSSKKCFQTSLKVFFIAYLSGFFLIFTIPTLISFSHYQPNIPPDSWDSRLAIYQSSSKIFLDNPFSGIGLNNFQSAYLTYQKFFPPYPQWAVPHAHNFFLHILTEGGLLAFIPFLILFFLTVKNFFKKKKTAFNAVILSILIYYLVHGLVDLPIWKNDLAMLFWFVIIAINLPIIEDDKDF